MPNVPIYWADGFARRPYCGRSAVICLMEAWPPTPAPQRGAAEFNVSG